MPATVGFDCLPFSRIAIIMPARAALLLTILVAVALPQFAPGASRPNIVLMVADDQRPDTIAALGNSIIRTPALDRLVREGTSFMRAVCAYPICVASRAEILTGCTAFRALQPYPDGKLNDSLPLLPRTLQAAGYRTCYVGKWHTTGRPTVRGYDLSHGLFAAGGANLALTVPTDRFGKAHTQVSRTGRRPDAEHQPAVCRRCHRVHPVARYRARPAAAVLFARQLYRASRPAADAQGV
jgi:arylsulfatase A-like enzyme